MTLANKITLSRTILGPVFIWVLFEFNAYFALGVIILHLIFDKLDGIISRWRKEKNSLGKNLDPVIDNLFLVFVFVGLTLKFNLMHFTLWYLFPESVLIFSCFFLYCRFRKFRVIHMRNKFPFFFLFIVATTIILDFYKEYFLIAGLFLVTLASLDGLIRVLTKKYDSSKI